MIYELLKRLNADARKRYIPIIADDGARFLFSTVSEKKPLRILEVGTAIGYSGILMLTASSDAHLVTVEIDRERAEEAMENFHEAMVSSRVRLICDDANVVINCLTQPFDFIFLDGPKGQYRTMFPTLLKLLNKDGIIFMDDMDYQGWIEGDDYPEHKHRTIITSLRTLIKELKEDKNLSVTFYQRGEGIAIIEKRG